MSLVLIDTSKWQGKSLDYGLIASKGIAGCATKCATGTYGADPTYERNWDAINGTMIRGAYFWFVPEHDPIKQAESWLSIAKPMKSEDLPYTVDFEQVTKIDPKRNLANVLACVRHLRKQTGRKCILYSGRWYWDLCAVDDSPELVAECYYWHAEYPSLKRKDPQDYEAAIASLQSMKPHLSKPWAIRGLPELFWQFDGDKGLYLPGGVDCDFNRYEGTLEDLKQVIADSGNPNDLPVCAAQDVFEKKDVQEELMAQGESLPVYGADGSYGTETFDAIRSYQGKNDLKVTGTMNPDTLSKLNEKRRERLAASGMCQ